MSPKRAIENVVADADNNSHAAEQVSGKKQKKSDPELDYRYPARITSTPKRYGQEQGQEHRDEDDSTENPYSLEKNAGGTRKAACEVEDETEQPQAKKPKGRGPDPRTKNQLLMILDETKNRAEVAEAENTQLRQDKKEQAKKTKALEYAQLRGNDQGRDFIQDDLTIRQNVQQLCRMIDSFVYEWVNPGFLMQVVGEKSARTVAKMLSGQDSRYPFKMLRPDDEEKFLWHPAGARKSAMSIVTKVIADEVLSRPFYFLQQAKVGAGLTVENVFDWMQNRRLY